MTDTALEPRGPLLAYADACAQGAGVTATGSGAPLVYKQSNDALSITDTPAIQDPLVLIISTVSPVVLPVLATRIWLRDEPSGQLRLTHVRNDGGRTKLSGFCHSISTSVPRTLLLTWDAQADTQTHGGVIIGLYTFTPNPANIEGSMVTLTAGTLELSRHRGPMSGLASLKEQLPVLNGPRSKLTLTEPPPLVTHCPATHILPISKQPLLQPPQCALLVVMFTHVLPQHVTPGAVTHLKVPSHDCPKVLRGGVLHTPSRHTWPVGQALKHAPQLVRSLERSKHAAGRE
jgi:hypothetical protein